MKNTIRILSRELSYIITRRSYLIFLFIVPLIGISFYGIALILQSGIAPEGVVDLFAENNSMRIQGIVDQSNLIRELPDELKNDLRFFQSEVEARESIALGHISSFFVIKADYLDSGKIDFIQKEYNFLVSQSETDNIRRLIIHNLMNNPSAAYRYLDPFKTEIVYLKELIDSDFGGSNNFWLPYSVMMLFYMLIIGSSSMMLNSITNEKKNRTMEILLTSVSPRELLIGKTIALGIAGVLQSVVWLTSSYTLLFLAGRQFSLPEGFRLEISFLAWGILFFILGYILYSNLMAGLGALVPNPKEGSQATIVIIFPLIIPLFFSNLIASSPNALIFVVFSLFPLTAPISMISRLSATVVPLWQLILSILLMLAAIVIIMRGVIRLFRAQNLLSGKSFKIKEFLRAFRSG